MLKLLKHLGQYFIMMKKVMSKPEKFQVFWKQLLLEIETDIWTISGFLSYE